MIRVLADGGDGPIGVLVDDPVCGRVLLDCGVGVTTAAAFAGISLAGVRVWAGGTGPDHLDPAVPTAHVVEHLPDAVELAAGRGRRSVLLTTAQGPLLHHTAPDALPARELPAVLTATLPLREPPPGITVLTPRTARRILVTGGSRSGKSALAEAVLAGRDVLYLATGPVRADDEEWQQRVRTHRERRPASWTTHESTDAAGVLAAAHAPVLLDSVGTWLTAAMDAAGTWEGRGDDELAAACDRLVDAWGATTHDTVVVTEEVGSGVVPATAAGRRFRDEVGALNARLAATADEVWLVTCGIGNRLR